MFETVDVSFEANNVCFDGGDFFFEDEALGPVLGPLHFALGDLYEEVFTDLGGDHSNLRVRSIGFVDNQLELVLAGEGPDSELGDRSIASEDLVREPLFFGKFGIDQNVERFSFGFVLCDGDLGSRNVLFCRENLGEVEFDVSNEGVLYLSRSQVALFEGGGDVVIDRNVFYACGQDGALANLGEVDLGYGCERCGVEPERRGGVNPAIE